MLSEVFYNMPVFSNIVVVLILITAWVKLHMLPAVHSYTHFTFLAQL